MRKQARLKIVFIESGAAMGGVQFSTLYLLQSSNSLNWEVTVVCPEEGDFSEACRRSNIAVHILGGPRTRSISIRIRRKGTRFPNPLAWFWNLWAMSVATRRLTRFLKQTKPDLVVTKGLFPHFYGAVSARYLGIPCVWHVQDFISQRFFRIYQRSFSQMSRWLPDQIIVDGAAIARQLHPTIRSRIAVIHNGIDTRVFRRDIEGHQIRRELGIPLDAIVIGHVGRITPWKGQHYLLEAFARIVPKLPNVYLLFAGSPVFDNDNYQRYLLRRTSKLGLGHLIKFAGYRHDIPTVLASMNVFAFTSVEKDTSPLTLLSAMSSGLPIVAFDIEGVCELMKPSEHFLSVRVRNIGELAESISQLVTDERLRHRLSRSARQLAVAEYSLDRHVCRMEQVFLTATRRCGAEFETITANREFQLPLTN